MPYERIPYTSFLWKFGTTSFRTKEFNRRTEWQLKLLQEFWNKPEYTAYGWERKYMFDGQEDIYWIKCRYYDWLVENEFMEGGEPENRKFKTAREKTSGLYDMGLINENHRLTEVGESLLRISEEQDFLSRTELGISKDSLLYLNQLLKVSYRDTGSTVRPLIVVLYLISEFDYLTLDEFTYLMPLCTDEFSTSFIVEFIKELRENDASIDDIIIDFLLSKSNYRIGLQRFCENEFSEELLLSVGMNRKSANYDRPYVQLFEELYAVYMENDLSRIVPLFNSVNNLTLSRKWKKLLFDTSNTRALNNDPEGHLLPLPDEAIASEEAFKEFFFKTMHLFKAKATLEDYMDLNRRYLGLTNCFLFDENQVTLDVVPKTFFNTSITELYELAYTESDLLFNNTSLIDICPALTFDEDEIISGINESLGTSVTTIEEALGEVEKLRYDRFNLLLEKKFSDETLLHLLDCFENRNDDEINTLVTDNADIPTIFEYILGIIWYKVSERKGQVLNYLKLSLDANLLPITHAAGGEADIVYEYKRTNDYPDHTLLLEATLADSSNQRRMEMEPVSRHLGNHLLRTHNEDSYCVFATTYLHINVIADFRCRKNCFYTDPQNEENFITSMKIIPICTSDLRCIIQNQITYTMLYKHFDIAFQADEMNPRIWHDNYVRIDNSNLINPQS